MSRQWTSPFPPPIYRTRVSCPAPVRALLSGIPLRPSRIPETLPFQKGQRLKTLRHLVRLFWEMWHTSPWLMMGTIVLRLIVALQPPIALLFTKFIIDEVVHQTGIGPLETNWLETGRLNHLLLLLLGEFALVFGRDILQRG